MTMACNTSASASSRRPPPRARATADEMPPPIAPPDSICIIMQPGNTSAMPASASVPRRETQNVSIRPVAACASITRMFGTASRNKVGAIGPSSSRRVRGSNAALDADCSVAAATRGAAASNGMLSSGRPGDRAHIRPYKGAYALLSRRRRMAEMNSGRKPGFQDCNCLAIRQAARHVTQFYDQLLAPLGLRATQYAILGNLRRGGPMTINTLAAALVMDRTTLGRNILPLQRDGLIEVVAAPADRRRRELRLTEKGQETHRRAHERWIVAQERFDNVFGSDRAAELRGLLREVAASNFADAPG